MVPNLELVGKNGALCLSKCTKVEDNGSSMCFDVPMCA